jgi:hypothetical protein
LSRKGVPTRGSPGTYEQVRPDGETGQGRVSREVNESEGKMKAEEEMQSGECKCRKVLGAVVFDRTAHLIPLRVSDAH